MEVEIENLEKAIQYITHEIESYLRQKAMNKLAIEKNKALR